MATVNEILSDACTNKFSCLPSLRHFDIALAQLLYDISINIGGGGGGQGCMLCGDVDPVDPPPNCTCAWYVNRTNSTTWYWDNRPAHLTWYKFG